METDKTHRVGDLGFSEIYMEIPIGHAGNLIYLPERLFYSKLYNQRVSHAQNARPTYLTPLADSVQTCLVTLGDATHDKFFLSLVS
jgi:hypothetical protein